MHVYLLILRWIHILSGVFWAGSTFLMATHIEPSIRASGPEGGKVMQRIAARGYAMVMGVAGGLNIVAGFILYWTASGHLRLAWITSGQGLALTLGGLSAIVAMVVGLGVAGRTVGRLQAVGAEVQAAGGPPSPEQAAHMASLSERLRSAGVWNAGLLVFTVLAMAGAQELFF
jgi:hypothetical protein